MLSTLIALALAAASAGSPHGLWKTPAGGQIRMAPCGADLCGTVVGSPHLSKNPDQKDVLNANTALRGRAIKGLRTLQVSPTGAGEWHKGWVYNPEDGKTYKAEVKLMPNGKLKVTGCVAKPLCQSQTWTRLGN
ncbi:DUF2147 domain-containing protein [Caulobacter sp. SLTY]|uniref:DUF2147 domain-containing protein n=1 Tax=Caulobacter sp. SLTY TaxID=2683262 RepID=UPI00141345B5|nr:DUF2147 domain-containing protein [Caulobacter sp. SLTY]